MKDLLTRALEAHGGLSRWREIEAFQLKASIGGGLWRLKGPASQMDGESKPGFETREIGPPEENGEDRVCIEDANGGVVEERATPRALLIPYILIHSC